MLRLITFFALLSLCLGHGYISNPLPRAKTIPGHPFQYVDFFFFFFLLSLFFCFDSQKKQKNKKQLGTPKRWYSQSSIIFFRFYN